MEAAGERLAGEGKTPLYFAIDGKLAGIIAVADVVKRRQQTGNIRTPEHGCQNRYAHG